MRQLIIGKNGVAGPASAAEGAAIIQVLGADGIPAIGTVASIGAAVTTDSQVRIARAGANAKSSEYASMWFRPSQIKNFVAKPYAAAVAQARAFNFVTGGAVGDVVTCKVIILTSGYEPFARYNFEVTLTATTATQAATDAQAVIAAEIAAGNCPEIASCAVATDGSDNSALLFTMAAGEIMEFAFDANGSAATMAYVSNGAAAMTKGNGVASELKAEELLLQGIDNSNYDRYTALPDEVYTTADVAGSTTYNVYVLDIQNAALGQIRGVDNMRQIKLAVPAAATTYLDGESSADSSGETMSRHLEALTGVARVVSTPTDKVFGCLNGN